MNTIMVNCQNCKKDLELQYDHFDVYATANVFVKHSHYTISNLDSNEVIGCFCKECYEDVCGDVHGMTTSAKNWCHWCHTPREHGQKYCINYHHKFLDSKDLKIILYCKICDECYKKRIGLAEKFIQFDIRNRSGVAARYANKTINTNWYQTFHIGKSKLKI